MTIYKQLQKKIIGSKFLFVFFLFTLTCSASFRRTSVDADPSLRNDPSVSFSRHMSRIALAVFPVSFRE